MAQAQVDEWCDELAKVHYMQVSDTHYAAIPREVRGVPHYTVPGLHAYLDDYENGLERARGLIGVTQGHWTVDSLQCLPFGPYTERLAPHIAESSDPTTSKNFRNPDDRTYADGRAFQVDASCPDVSIFREPLVSCVAITAPQDNIFAQCQPFLASVLGAAAVMARHARTAHRLAHAHAQLPRAVSRPREELQLQHRLCAGLHAGDAPPPGCNHFLPLCVMAMLNAILPASHAMATRVLWDAYARGPALCARAMRAQAAAGEPAVGRSLPEMVAAGELPAESLEEARRFWAPFARTNAAVNAWARLEPLLLAILEADGSYDNSLATLDAFWAANDQLLRGVAWLAASPDGHKAPEHPSPLAGVRSWTQVRAEHLTPVFVGSTNPQTGKHTPARASLVGVMPMGLQQLLHGLIGAARDETAVAQCDHNFGYLIYRPSAAPDIMTPKNRERSSKAISCVNVDGDEPAFGTREEKVKMCKLHRAAWAANLDYVRPLCTRIAPPRSDERRARGDRAAVDYIKERKRDLDAVGVHMKQEHDAAALFHAAAVQQPRPPPRPPPAGAPAQSGGSR